MMNLTLRSMKAVLVSIALGTTVGACSCRETTLSEQEYYTQNLYGPNTHMDFSPVSVCKGGIADINSDFAAVTIWNQINMSTVAYEGNYSETGSPLFGHELVHVWQFQNRRWTGYSIWRALREHLEFKHPYRYDAQPILDGTSKEFTKFRFEQQGAIVEDYFWYLRSNSPIFRKTAEVYRKFLDEGMDARDRRQKEEDATRPRTEKEELRLLSEMIEDATSAADKLGDGSADSFATKYSIAEERDDWTDAQRIRWIEIRAERAKAIKQLIPQILKNQQ